MSNMRLRNGATQRANCSEQTRRKARRLQVTTLATDWAAVQGDSGRWEVRFDGLSCDCPAGLNGLHCSHVEAALLARAAARGQSVRFCASAADAAKIARMEEGKGKVATVHADAGWHWVELADAAAVAPQVVATAPRSTRFDGLTDAEKQKLWDELF